MKYSRHGGVLADWEIEELSVTDPKMVEGLMVENLNPFGYDLTLHNEFLIPTFDTSRLTLLDPMDSSSAHLVQSSGDWCIIPPNSFVLGRSVEKINMPNWAIGICLGRSTYARCGIIANVTPLEAGWSGTVTIELSNSTPMPAKVYAGRGIVQVVFFTGSIPDRTYVSKGGRYQGQEDITPAKGWTDNES